MSSVTVAEIGIKSSLGKLDVPSGILDTLESGGFDELAFGFAHAEVLRDLPWHHRDPFDRMLIAQAMAEGMPLLSTDRRMATYDVAII